jgi:RimJ/RimL family protein N-acetyltransferase
MDLPIIQGKKIYLRRLTEDDATQEYVGWMNDSEINQYLESRFYEQTIESTKAYIRSVTNDNNYQFGIFLNESGKHIGNIKIGSINHFHRYADIGFLIGDKSCWGRGIATEAIKLATDFAFNTLKLHKLWGGAYSPNIGSIKAFLKNGYQQEGAKKNQYLCHGQYVDDILFGKVNPNE